MVASFNRSLLIFFLFINCTAVGLFAPIVSQAARKCDAVISLFDVNQLIQWRKLLDTQAIAMDPASTHLDVMIPALNTLSSQVKRALVDKKNDKLYLDRKPLIENILLEIKQRIESKQVTYEWIFGLPIRIGYLLRMTSEPRNVRNFISPEIETSAYYQVKTYTTHENFMKALTQVRKYGNNKFHRPPSMATWFEELKTFPRRIHFPAFQDITIPEMNRLFAAKIFPLGMIAKPIFSQLDKNKFDEFEFPLHDLGHVQLLDLSAYQDQAITSKMADALEVSLLNEIDRTQGLNHEIFHVFHLLLFHESIRNDYLDDASMPGLEIHYKNELENALKQVDRIEAQEEVFPIEFLNKSPEEKQVLLSDLQIKFAKLVKNALQTQKNLLEPELARIHQHKLDNPDY